MFAGRMFVDAVGRRRGTLGSDALDDRAAASGLRAIAARHGPTGFTERVTGPPDRTCDRPPSPRRRRRRSRRPRDRSAGAAARLQRHHPGGSPGVRAARIASTAPPCSKATCPPRLRHSTTAGRATSSSPPAGTSWTPTVCSPRSGPRRGTSACSAAGARRSSSPRCCGSRASSEDRIQAIRSPVGLDLGGRTPAEIALSVMAEITKETVSGDGESAQDRFLVGRGPGAPHTGPEPGLNPRNPVPVLYQ